MESVNISKLKVGVIFGGRSGEHEVSLVSANSIINALNPSKYEVIPVGISRKGGWTVGVKPDAMIEHCRNNEQEQLAFIGSDAGKASFNCDSECSGLVLLDKPETSSQVQLDVLFPVVHGTYGEDGTLQGMLEMAGLPYVGCGVLASAVGMDKGFSKKLFRESGLDVAPGLEFLRNDWKKNPDKICVSIENELGYPCFVKPTNSGSSVGISKAKDRASLVEAMHMAARYDRKILVEAFVNGREIEVSVLGNDEPSASLPGEIVPCNEFYDYSAKYVDDRSELKIPADLSEEQVAKIREMAIRAYKAIDCSGMARVDFFLERDTGRIIINEINTIPGFTSISMYPKLWEASGTSYEQLVDRLIELAIERHQERQESLLAVS